MRDGQISSQTSSYVFTALMRMMAGQIEDGDDEDDDEGDRRVMRMMSDAISDAYIHVGFRGVGRRRGARRGNVPM